MITRTYGFVFGVVLLLIAGGCSQNAAETNSAAAPAAQATLGKNFTSAGIAKLKWIEGTWRGMDGEKSFFERYRVTDNAITVESLQDGDPSKVEDTSRFELTNGEFGSGEGDKRSVATDITDNHVQFVPAVPGKRNNFRFEHQPDGTWHAILEWPATAEKAAQTKVYKMEPWEKR